MRVRRGVLAKHAEIAEVYGRGAGPESAETLRPDENEIGGIVLTEAIQIHRELGPGLLESVYESVLAHALRSSGLRVTRQELIGIEFRGIRLSDGFRADLIVEDKVMIEVKSVDKLIDVHKKQLLTYLRLTGLKLGYLLNFGGPMLKNGVHRIANGVEEPR